MIRKYVPWLLCPILASATALGADFQFSARVAVLPSLSVSAASTGDPAPARAILSVSGSQDQCLDVRWVEAGERRPVAIPAAGDDPDTGLYRLDDRGRGTLAAIPADVPAVAVVQITLN